MDIQDLKKKITSNTLSDDVLILKYVDNKFICNQYVDAIAKNKNKEKIKIESITEIDLDDVFGANENSLFILDVDELTEYPTKDYKNLIVVTKKVPDNLNIDYIDMGKTVNWQIEDYVATRLPGLDRKEVEWLCKVCQYEIYRLENECDKLAAFNPSMQSIMFNQISNENGYCDLNTLTVFDLTDGIIRLDREKINTVLRDREFLDLEPGGVLTILCNNYKKLIEVYYSNTWSSSMTVSEKQYKFYKAVMCKPYKDRLALVKIYEMLTQVDFLLKSGKLEYNRITDYIISNIFAIVGEK